MNIDDKVKLINIIRKPIGVITRKYSHPDYRINYEYIYWIRLKNGILIKDITENEIEKL